MTDFNYSSMGRAFEGVVSLELQDLLAKGYFPRELPPCFSTNDFAGTLTSPSGTIPIEFTKKKDTRCPYAAFSLARPAALRRRLAIINPIPFFRLASAIVLNQTKLFSSAAQTPFSVSYPRSLFESPRAITTRKSWGDLPRLRARSRVGKRFLLKTDIARFYPSIYTHSLDWALTSKKKAKLKFGPGVRRLGSRIDALVQAAQAGQTRGIPIGPDTSLLLSHVLLFPVDKILKRKGVDSGFRFMDDYELVFETRSGAEKGLAILEEALAEYELELNTLKTQIVELPSELDHPGILELRSLPIRSVEGGQDSDLIHFFNVAFELARKYPNKAILNYAVGKIRNLRDDNHCAELSQELTLQCVMAEPGLWPMALPLLQRLHSSDGALDTDPIRSVINLTICEQAPKGHSSEVARSLWAALIFELEISKSAVIAVARMRDDVCWLLLLYAESLGLAEIPPASRKKLVDAAAPAELRGEHWLFAYESVAQGWIVPSSGNYLVSDEVFEFLFNEHVRFLDVGVLSDAKAQATEEEPYDDYGNQINQERNDPDFF